jgi:L,D-transpeptidase catalytic domain
MRQRRSRSRRRRPRYLAATGLVAFAAALGVVAVPAGGSTFAVFGPAAARAGATSAAPTPATQPLAILLGAHVARRAPHAGAGRIESVAGRRPLTRIHTTLPVLGRHGGWLRVRLPGRPDGHSGWIVSARTRAASTPWRIEVVLSTRQVIVFREGRIVRRFTAIVGKRSTPTPRGRFFVEEALRLRHDEPGAPFALATSARSNTLQEFDGGPGQIALHGTAHLSGLPGTAASHGCIRLATPVIAWMASRIGAGVPVTIVDHLRRSPKSRRSDLNR